jgi:prepilin-type N-terminal cleavage/methylation domain-containing protein
MTRRTFTLLEVMIAIVLIGITSGVIGFQMHQAIGRKKFKSNLDRLSAQFSASQKMAIAMQADWKGTLRKEGKNWIFDAICEEIPEKRLNSLPLGPIEIQFNGKKTDSLSIHFCSSGKTFPEGSLLFTYEGMKAEWKMSDLLNTKSVK